MLIYAFIPIFSLDPPASRLIFSPGNNSSCSVHSVSCPDSKLLKDLQFNVYSFIFTFFTSLQLLSILHSKKKRLKTNSKSYRRSRNKCKSYNSKFLFKKKQNLKIKQLKPLLSYTFYIKLIN